MNKAVAGMDAGSRVVVLCGGTGTEREVSLVSGRAIGEALGSLDIAYEVVVLDSDRLPGHLDPATDLVLPIIHGTYGEDGRLSAELDAGGFSYGGCDAASSRLCFDKVSTKDIARQLEIPVANDLVWEAGKEFSYEEITASLGDRFIMKPQRDGSSVGLHLVDSKDAFEAAFTDSQKADYLVESYHEGYDLTVGILKGEALGVVGVHPDGQLYDYKHKYTQGLSRYDVPAQIEPTLEQQLRDWSEKLFETCGCRDLARVDFLYGKDGLVRFLEINTLPGMTPTSLLPKSAQCKGIDFESLVQNWVEQIAFRQVKEVSL